MVCDINREVGFEPGACGLKAGVENVGELEAF